MKNIFNTIAETILLLSLFTLVAIPVVVFGSFSPTVKKTTAIIPSSQKKDVLGAKSYDENQKLSYSVEMLVPETTPSITVENIQKDIRNYSSEFFINKTMEIGNVDLLRFVNETDTNNKFRLNIDFGNNYQDNSLSIKINNSTFSLSDLAKEPNFRPAITLEPEEWLLVGISNSDILNNSITLKLYVEIIPE
jgi:hypothetical protein